MEDYMFSNYKLGKKKAVHSPLTKKLTAPLKKAVGDIPDNINWINGVTWPMWNNDKIGCCTQVSVASALRTWTYNVSEEIMLSDKQVIDNYSAESGYNPENPSSDQGGVETEVLRKWCIDGYETPSGNIKLNDFGYVNPKDTDNVKRAIYLFGGLYIGLSLPQYSLEIPNGVWDIQYFNNQIAGGHAVYLHGFDDSYLYLNTWGSEWKMTWSFFEKYCDEAYGLISNEWINKNATSPLGESLNILIQELNSI